MRQSNLADPRKYNPPMVKPISTRIRQLLLGGDVQKGTDRLATCAINHARAGGTLFRLSQREDSPSASSCSLSFTCCYESPPSSRSP